MTGGQSHHQVATEPPATFASSECYLIVPQDDQRTFRVNLCPGKFVVGRSQIEVDDRWFINLESPNCAVSRQHAELVLCHNGDAWVADLNSTNGSFLSIRSTEGEGVRLEPGYKYQLSDGALIIFGEIEVRFFRKDVPPPSASMGASAAALRSATPVGPGRSGAALPSAAVSMAAPRAAAAVSEGRVGPMPSVLSTGALVKSSDRPPNHPEPTALASFSNLADDVASMNRRLAAAAPSAEEPPASAAAPVQMDGDGALAAAADLAARNGSSSAGPSKADVYERKESAPSVPDSTGAGDRVDSNRPAASEPEVAATAAGADDSEEPPATAKKPKGKKAAPKKASGAKRTAKAAAEEEEDGREAVTAAAAVDTLPSPPSRRARKDDTRTLISFGASVEACLTGFDTRGRTKIAKMISARGGRVVEEWDSASSNLLVVKESPTGRTPKLIMAVGSGADVVTPIFVERGDVPCADACPGVKVDSHRFTPAKIRSAIVQHRDIGHALAGRSYVTASVTPKASREQLNVIIRGCGGTVAPKGKSAKAIVLEDGDIDAFYNGILTGELHK